MRAWLLGLTQAGIGAGLTAVLLALAQRPLRRRVPARWTCAVWLVLTLRLLAADRIIHIMVNISDLIRQTHDLAFQSSRHRGGLMIQNTVPYLHCQIDTLPVLLQKVHCSHTLFVMFKPVRTGTVKRPLPRMPERRMSQIMSQRNGLHQILVKLQGLRNRSGRLADFQCMRQARSVVVSFRCQKHLRLILQPPERLTMYDPVPIPLEYRPDIALFFRSDPSLGIHTEPGIGTEILFLPLFQTFPYIHGSAFLPTQNNRSILLFYACQPNPFFILK